MIYSLSKQIWLIITKEERFLAEQQYLLPFLKCQIYSIQATTTETIAGSFENIFRSVCLQVKFMISCRNKDIQFIFQSWFYFCQVTFKKITLTSWPDIPRVYQRQKFQLQNCSRKVKRKLKTEHGVNHKVNGLSHIFYTDRFQISYSSIAKVKLTTAFSNLNGFQKRLEPDSIPTWSHNMIAEQTICQKLLITLTRKLKNNESLRPRLKIDEFSFQFRNVKK